MSQPTPWVSAPLFGDVRTPRLTEREHEQYLLSLREIPREQYRLEVREYRLIEGARNLGVTWKRIAESLCLESPRAAARRYEKLRALLADADRRELMAPSVREVRLNGRRAAGRVALIDDEDWDLISRYNWHIRFGPRGVGGPYALGQPKGSPGGARQVFMHALIMGRTGIDHKNHNGLDNRRSNLRISTPAENARNVRKQAGAKFRYKGVHFDDRYLERKWVAKIHVGGQYIGLGRFLTEEEGARAYDAAALEHFGEFACLNFPEACGEHLGA